MPNTSSIWKEKKKKNTGEKGNVEGEKKEGAGKRRNGQRERGRGYEVGGEPDEERRQQSQTKLKGPRVGLLRRAKSGGAEKSLALPLSGQAETKQSHGLVEHLSGIDKGTSMRNIFLFSISRHEEMLSARGKLWEVFQPTAQFLGLVKEAQKLLHHIIDGIFHSCYG